MISREEVLNLANLSKLYLDESEIVGTQKEVEGMIDFVNEINNINANFKDANAQSNISNAFHEDEIKESYPREEILKNVNGGKDGFFYIKKFN